MLLLDHYHCTFFLPLIPALGHRMPPLPDAYNEYLYGSTENAYEEDEAEAYHFFTPTLRNILFHRVDQSQEKNLLDPIQEWRLPKELIQHWCLTLEAISPDPPKEGETPKYVVPDKNVRIESVHLYRYFNGLCLLAYTVKPACNEGMELEDWLHFTRLGRQLYPTFTEQRYEKKLAPLVLSDLATHAEPIRAFDQKMPIKLPPIDQPGADISPIIKHFVKSFFKPTTQPTAAEWLEESIALYDDRMFVSVAYGFPEDTLLPEPEQDAGKNDWQERLKALVALTDRFRDTQGFGKKKDEHLQGYPYTKTAIDRYLQNQWMEFWSAIGGHYVYTDKVNAYLSDGWFFNNIVAPKHIPQIYNRMLIQALFYQASLRHYDHQITATTKELFDDPSKIQIIKNQLKDFIRFTNQYWFSELTDQMQGKEICRLQQQGLNLQLHYERIKEKISRTDEYLNVQREARSSKLSNNLTFFGAVFAFGALYLAFLPILNDMIKELYQCSLWEWGAKCIGELWTFLLVGSPLVLIIILALWWARTKD
ncbi:hypothetical protein [Candidatus Thiothrix anitrata]|uniref:Uncharacterized protein n=1 Tax=Candidatus Thiothrix anitrata TaxID=2823902 RepID=A0ABX7X0Y0_9GAMM|nr:hypothetical protein [Candidatus Thiothrix anitrata]QTR49601.1 hypothetical protein J8380_15400 [Candidatus Thiothrix anitrata]